jgi:hypothetical protein
MTLKENLPFQLNCPYLSITSIEVVCKATDWGKGLDGSQKYGPLPRSMILNCSSPKHLQCTMYQRKKKEDARGENWQDTT